MRVDEIEPGKRAGELELPRSVERAAAVMSCGWNHQSEEDDTRECGSSQGDDRLRLLEDRRVDEPGELRATSRRTASAAPPPTFFFRDQVQQVGATRSGKPWCSQLRAIWSCGCFVFSLISGK